MSVVWQVYWFYFNCVEILSKADTDGRSTIKKKEEEKKEKEKDMVGVCMRVRVCSVSC